MALPLASAGLRVAMAIAKFAGKKLTKKGKQGYKLSRSLVKSKRVRTAYTKATVRKKGTALDYASKQASIIGKQTKRHLKFYSKVIAPGGTAPNKFATARGLKHLITRPTFGQKEWIKPIRNYRKASGGLSAPLGYPEKKKMGMYTGYYYDRLSGQRSKRLKRTAIGGLIGYKVFGNGD